MLIVALVLFCLAVAVLCAVAIDSLWPTSSRSVPQPDAPDRHGWCETCGVELSGADLHEVVATFDDSDLDVDTGGGGTGIAAEYCAVHCPGGCRAPHRAAA